MIRVLDENEDAWPPETAAASATGAAAETWSVVESGDEFYTGRDVEKSYADSRGPRDTVSLVLDHSPPGVVSLSGVSGEALEGEDDE